MARFISALHPRAFNGRFRKKSGSKGTRSARARGRSAAYSRATGDYAPRTVAARRRNRNAGRAIAAGAAFGAVAGAVAGSTLGPQTAVAGGVAGFAAGGNYVGQKLATRGSRRSVGPRPPKRATKKRGVSPKTINRILAADRALGAAISIGGPLLLAGAIVAEPRIKARAGRQNMRRSNANSRGIGSATFSGARRPSRAGVYNVTTLSGRKARR